MQTSFVALCVQLLLVSLPVASGYVAGPPAGSITTPRKPSVTKAISLDTTTIGSVTVPSVGIGTISWSSTSLTGIENDELKKVVDEAWQSNAVFLDTAERYGSHFKTAVGLGQGETEKMIQKFLQRSNTDPAFPRPKLAPVVATK
jgi:hypothetical protein